jgi:hypothetical protein
MDAAHPVFGGGLSAAIERHHHHPKPRPAVDSNYKRLEITPTLEAACEPEAERGETRGLVELALGVVGTLAVIDGLRSAWLRLR